MDLRNGDIVLNRDVTPYNRYSSKYSPSLFERNGILYVNINTYILALSIRENKIIWETDNSEMYVLQDLHIYNNKLIKCAISATCEYDTANGKLLSLSDYQGSSFSTLYGKYLFIIDRKLRLLILDLDSGRIVNSILCKYSDAGENFFGSYPTIIDDKLYIMSTNALYRYNLSDLLN